MDIQKREPFNSLALYSLSKWIILDPIWFGYFRCRVYDVEKMPQQGAVIVVSNHASNLDPPMLSCCMRRPLAFMAKEELFQVPLLGKLIEKYGAYPVKRGEADRSAIRAAIKMIEEGWATSLFLQGTRTSDGRINDPKKGAAYIAAKVQAPLLPVSLWGTHKMFQKGSAMPRPVPVTIRVGDLIDPPASTKSKDVEAVTQKCAQVINGMHDLGR